MKKAINERVTYVLLNIDRYLAIKNRLILKNETTEVKKSDERMRNGLEKLLKAMDEIEYEHKDRKKIEKILKTHFKKGGEK